MTEPILWTREQLLEQTLGETAIWASASVYAPVKAALPYPILDMHQPLPTGLKTLIVVGGGTLIDQAKAQVSRRNPPLHLVAIPSIWGSGAEATPIVVLNRDGKKEIHVGQEYLPYARVIWPELAGSVTSKRAREGCGDCWAHALEAFLSPLAASALRVELAGLIRRLLSLGLTETAAWLDVSAQAASAQARAGVGLVHGIAHTLEGPLQADPIAQWGHAKVCALFLFPVMSFNRSSSERWDSLVDQAALDGQAILKRLREFFDEREYTTVLPFLKEHWPVILRDPCTRTNSTLVRVQSLDYFQNKRFL